MVLYQSRHDATEYGRLAQLVEHLLDVQEVTGSSPVPSTTKIPSQMTRDFLRGRDRTRTARPRRRRGKQQPSGLLFSARFPIFRNVYQESAACRSTICRASVGRYRTRTAAEPTATTTSAASGGSSEELLGPRPAIRKQGAADAGCRNPSACGGNREARLGPRSDFSRPRQGAAEKSANATRQGRAPQLQLP